MSFDRKKALFFINLLMMAPQKNQVDLLEDLLTSSEIDKIYERIQILSQLNDNISQREIANDMKVGIATITRGSAVMKKSSIHLSSLFDEAKHQSWWPQSWRGKAAKK